MTEWEISKYWKKDLIIERKIKESDKIETEQEKKEKRVINGGREENGENGWLRKQKFEETKNLTINQ